jgi:DNA polymerase (family 10)
VTKQDAAVLLRHYATLLDLLGEDSFRARAYDNAARMLETQIEPLESLIAEQRLGSIKGIGKSIAASIIEAAERGSFKDLEEVALKVPPGVIELLRVDGLGPKKAHHLWHDANITSLKELESALSKGTLEHLSGFGAKTAEKFRASLEFIRTASGRHWRHYAVRAEQTVRASLETIPGITEIFFGGSLLRGCETVGDLDILVIAPRENIPDITVALRNLNTVRWTETTGDVMLGATPTGFNVELSVIPPEDAVLRKILVTGSKEYTAALAEFITARKAKPLLVNAATEEEIFKLLDLEFVPPPLREGSNLLHPAGSIRFPEPVKMADIRGIFHCHTTASDGHNTLRELAEAMIAKGYDYLGIADHSKVAAYANGLTPARVRDQWKAIDDLNMELAPFKLLKGTEVDILADGRLDFDDELLAGFDFVIASIHSGFNMTEAEATKRLCKALENPHVDILGHLTGRLLLERNGYAVDHEQVILCAALNGKAIELNANPHRLDIDWRWLALCEQRSVPVPLSPDAHVIEGLWDLKYGIDVAAKGPLTAANCPNTWSADKFLNWCQTHPSQL